MAETLQRDRARWLANDVDKSTFTIAVPPEVLERADAILAALGDVSVTDITPADFSDPVIATFMKGVLQELEQGPGIAILAGVGARYSDEDLVKLYWGLATYLGKAEVQSIFGDRIGHVRRSDDNPTARGYRSDQELSMHTDSTDIASLMCLKQAMSGGVSQFSSSIAIHDEIARLRPDLMPALYAGYPYYDAEMPVGEEITKAPVPVFSHIDGVISCRYLGRLISEAAEALGEDLPAQLVEGMALIDTLAADERFKVEFFLEPSEMAFFNNFTTFHARTAFEDFPEPERRRHLVRLWLMHPGVRDVGKGMRFRGEKGIWHQPERVLAMRADA